MKPIFTILMSCALSLTNFAQTTVTIGSGTSTQGGPISRFFRYHASEFIYLQSEINETGEIQSIAFDKRSGTDNNPILDVSIYMRHTTETTLASGTTSTAGYTLVYSGSFTNNLATGWMQVNLTTPFAYNNTDNLQVLIIKGNQAPLTSAQYPRYSYTVVNPNRFRSYSDDSNAWSTSRTLTTQAGPPNVRFTISAPCVQPEQPEVACYETAVWNAGLCQWDVSGTQPAAPTDLACWETANFDETSCDWQISGTQPQGTDVVTACGSYEWIDGTTYSASNNTATHTLVGAAENGCDSLVTLNLIIVNINSGVTANGAVLTATQTGASYQWINCATGAQIQNATAQSYTATANGSFQVEVTIGDCSELSECVNVTSLSLTESDFASQFRMFPNPTQGMVQISLPEGTEALTVLTITGQELMTLTTSAQHSVELDLSAFPKGTYLVRLHHSNITVVEKLIRE